MLGSAALLAKNMLPMTIGIKYNIVKLYLDASGGQNCPKLLFLSQDIIIDSYLFIVFGNNVFVSSMLSTAQEVYDVIVTTEMEDQTSVILDLGVIPSYWGYTKKELWSWINEHSVK